MWGNIPFYQQINQQIKKRANDLDIIILSEADQARETQICGITSMWNLKYVTKEHIYKTKIGSKIQKTNYNYERMGGKLGF